MTLLRPTTFALMIAALAGPAMAEMQSVTILNQTDIEIIDLYADEYADRGAVELLGDDTLEPGESITVTIEGDPENDCVGDLRAMFADGSTDTIEDANICDDHDYTFD